ncbi:MAG: pilus assembly protein PilM [Syntrophales bacterium]|nr:pilus assembly protein PilM [Syntrophales bacterium]
MKEYSIGIDIGERSIKAVKIQRSRLSGRVEILALEELSYEKKTELRLVLEYILKKEPFVSGKVNLNLPMHECYFVSIPMPFSSRKKVEQTIHYEIESRVPFSLRDFKVDYQIFPTADGTSEVLVAMIPSSRAEFYGELLNFPHRMMRYLDISGLSSFGLIAESLNNKTSFVYVHQEASSVHLLFCNQERLADIRSLAVNGETENAKAQIKAAINLFKIRSLPKSELAIYVSGNGSTENETFEKVQTEIKEHFNVVDLRTLLRVEMDERLASRWHPQKFNEALALAYRGIVRPKEGFHLVSPHRGLKDLLGSMADKKWFAVAAGIVLFLFILEGLLEYVIIQTKIKGLENEMRRAYQALIPDSGAVKDPLRRLTALVEQERKKGSSFHLLSFPSFVHVMGEISRLIPPDYKILIDKMDYRPPSVTMKGVVKDPSSAEKIKQRLEQSSLIEKADLELPVGAGKEERIYVTYSLKLKQK